LSLYEGMYIFPDTMDEDAVDVAVKAVVTEIDKLGGVVKNTVRLGRRKFAREMKKTEFGYYVVMTFELDGKNVEPLKARYAISEDVMRVQIVRAEEEEVVLAQADAPENTEKEDGQL